MSQNSNNHSTLRQYLLGQVSGEERDQFEVKLFSDEEFFEELLIAEDELIEAKIGHELSTAEADQFEEFFLITSDRQEKLKFRRALQRIAKETKLKEGHFAPTVDGPVAKNTRLKDATRTQTIRSWIPQLAASFVALVIIGGIIWMVLPRTSVERTLVAAANERATGLPSERLALPRQYDDLKLHLALPQPAIPAKDYSVEMRSTDGQTVILKPHSHNEQFVDVVIPTKSLSPGVYAFKVSVIKPDSTIQNVPYSYLLTIE